MKSAKELRTMSLEELTKLLEDTRRELFYFKTKVRANELKAVSSIRQLKRFIASILTVMKQRRNGTNTKS